jgi:mono/diheme cytochrome c family protein
MKWTFGRGLVLLALATSLDVFGKLTPEQIQQLPPPATHEVDFVKEIKPILEASCIKCHGRGRSKGEFRIDTRETLLKGGETGPAAVPGKSVESQVIELVMGFDPDNTMPKKGSRLSRDQIGVLRAWIDQGLKWDENVKFGRAEPINLQPRRPELPAGGGKSNPIDALLRPYFAAHQVKPGKPVEDRVFVRRVYLDVIGLLPPPEKLEQFVRSKAADKRARLVRELLADNQEYAVHWLTFWNDALRNDYRGTGYIDGGRTQITQWLYAALANNLPYDQFVAQLINPKPESEGFTKGIVWRGVVNASQTPQMQAAQNISQVFMGVNLKCASCHDSFINDWMLADAYGLAGIYAEGPLEMVLCDKPTGQQAALKFIYPQLGDLDAKADKPLRLKQLAHLICGPQDGRLTRTLVNRLWQKFLGRGLVEPADDMEKAAWHPDLLDWLAEDFADHHYDVKHVIEQILTSQAYQLPAVSAQERDRADFVFRGPLVRRMSAEQFRDGLASLTGIGYSLPTANLDFSAGKSQSERAGSVPAAAKWIWSEPAAAEKASVGTIRLRKSFALPAVPAEATVMVVCDNSFVLYLNGKKVGEGNDYTKPYFFDIRSRLVKGENFLSVKAVNALPGNATKKDDQTGAGQENPAGFLFYARLRDRTSALDFASDASWIWSSAQSEEWLEPKIQPDQWKPAIELGDLSIAPWKLGTNYVQKIFSGVQPGRVRAALVTADPLQTALGRPNREQVVTLRSPSATTLQALELTNGADLARLLQRGAEEILNENPRATPRALVERLYGEAFGRRPTTSESRLGTQILGARPRQDGLEDLIWSLAMLPEFQLIY